MHITSVIAIACWVAWALYWAASWNKEKPVTHKQNPRQMIAYTAPLMLGFILALTGTGHISLLDINLVPYSATIAVIGAGLCVLGLLLTIWSRRILADNWSADVAFKQGQELVTAGPYAIVRHPIYTGITTLFIGTAIIEGTAGVFVAVVLAFISFAIKLGQEEDLLTAHFGSSYLAYQKRTKKIIPYIY